MTEDMPDYRASVQRISDVESKLAVEVPWDLVEGKLDEAYRELGRGVALKGFRKGRVPRAMLEKMFSKHVNEEVAQRLVHDSMSKVLKEHDVSPLAEPEIDDEGIQSGQDFKYSAVLQVAPDIDPKDYFDVAVKRRKPVVSDEAIVSALQSKQKEMTEYIPIEGRKTQSGDIVLVDIMGKVGDEPVSHEHVLIELGAKTNHPLPNLAQRLEGIDPSEKELDLEFNVAADDAEPGFDGPQGPARLLITIHDIKQKVVPELDDEFAKDTGEAQTLQELKEKMAQKLLDADQRKADEDAKQALVASILEKNNVPVVPALVERHMDNVMQIQRMITGASSGELEGLRENMRGEAENVVRSALLLKAIARKENVAVDEADIERKIAEMASLRGENPQKVRAEYEKNGRIDQLRDAVREEKTLDLLLSKAKVAEIKDEPADEPTNKEAASHGRNP